MSKAECPYCGEDQEINHDDGYGYEEGETYEQDCHSCGNTFAYTTSISFSYDTTKAPCMNGEDHKWRPTATAPKWHTKMACEYCDERREMADAEKVEHNIPQRPYD